jgi:hypothetical protein
MRNKHAYGSVSRLRPAAALAAAVLLLAACAGGAPKPAPAVPAAAPPALDASYDWHVLVKAPFGSLLKDAPFALHEVLLFREQAHGGPATDDAECYATDATPPRFIDRNPDQYLLCFTHDRLSRMEASVLLPASQAPQVFADACGLWMKHAAAAAAAPTATSAPTAPTAPAAPAAPAANPPAGVCEGSDSGIAFSGRLEEEGDSGDALLSIKLRASGR